jgi:uncharacterized protein YcgL (UPF0745 family)
MPRADRRVVRGSIAVNHHRRHGDNAWRKDDPRVAVQGGPMQCFVYKSLRKSDTYVFLRERDGFGVMPPDLRERLGTLAFVIELTLSPERRLARENVDTVMANLRSPGFHLQFPPYETGIDAA